MARKTTFNKSAAKKADARKQTPKAGVRVPVSSAKAAPRKGQSAHAPALANVQTKRVVKPPVVAKADPTVKKPNAPVKTVAVKAQAKPAHPAKQQAAAMLKPALPKAAIKSGIIVQPKAAAPAVAHMMPTTLPKQFGQKPPAQPLAGVVPPKAIVQKAMLSRQQTAVSKQQAAAAASKKPVHQRHGFKTNEWIVYPAHGVGRIVGIEEQEIAGMSLELFVITFEKDKMTLRVPTGKSASVGMRKLAEEGVVKRAMETLKGRARIKRTMWSRRAQEYEAKINSGDLVAIAEVVRDLYRSESQPEQSYSERQLYEAALDRMAREIAAVEKLDERGAVQRITEVLAKSAKGRRIAAEEAEVKAA
jgi:CarD family transcriptional regulator